MIELKNNDLHYISGGYDDGDSNCPGCNGEWDKKDNEYKNPMSFGAPGVGSSVGARLGSPFGKFGTAVGSIAGYLFYDSVDYNQVGENYKMKIMSELNSGNLPAD